MAQNRSTLSLSFLSYQFSASKHGEVNSKNKSDSFGGETMTSVHNVAVEAIT